MNAEQILALAEKYRQMYRVSLHGWKFRINPRLTTTAGMTYYGKRIIELSDKVMREWDEAEVIDTILHEIAHAMTGKEQGHHGEKWKAKCREIGAKPERTYGDDLKISMRFTGRCACGEVFQRARRSESPHCFSKGAEWLDNHNPELGYKPFVKPPKSSVVGSPEWAKARVVELGGTYAGGYADAPKGSIWRSEGTHGINVYADYFEGREGAKMLRYSMEDGFESCYCGECSA